MLNSTCIYILTRMECEGLPFETILADAQALGYAETPPDLPITPICDPKRIVDGNGLDEIAMLLKHASQSRNLFVDRGNAVNIEC